MRHRSFDLSSFDPYAASNGLLGGFGGGRKKTRTHDALEAMSRIGFAADGVVYVSVGLPILATTVGMRGQAVDQQGLFYVMAQQPLGRVWLVVLGVGL